MRRLYVLLVEDDDDMRTLYGFMLAKAGFQVRGVKDGIEALAEIQAQRPDVIITDIAMPVVSGLDLIKIIRSDDNLSDLPVVAITAYGENLRQLAKAIGANEAIDKPTEEERLRRVINAILASQQE